MGSIILPAILVLSGSPFLFGWAKPVPYNPYNLRGKWGEALVAGAGPAANVLIALVFGLLLQIGLSSGLFSVSADILYAASLNPFWAIEQYGFTVELGLIVIIFLNIFLSVFNLIPIPPLDGSKILPQLLPRSLVFKYEQLRRTLEGNMFIGFGAVLIFILIFGTYIAEMVSVITRILIGA